MVSKYEEIDKISGLFIKQRQLMVRTARNEADFLCLHWCPLDYVCAMRRERIRVHIFRVIDI